MFPGNFVQEVKEELKEALANGQNLDDLSTS
jgi:hypothetical protein